MTSAFALISFKDRLKKVWSGWVSRSLVVGSGATIIDLLIGTIMVHGFGIGTRISAMTGVLVGSAFSYFANRYFAFRERTSDKVVSSILKFVGVTIVSSIVHGQLVVWLTEKLSLSFVAAKLIADIVIFGIGQLFLLRYIVFPTTKKNDAAVAVRPARGISANEKTFVKD